MAFRTPGDSDLLLLGLETSKGKERCWWWMERTGRPAERSLVKNTYDSNTDDLNPNKSEIRFPLREGGDGFREHKNCVTKFKLSRPGSELV